MELGKILKEDSFNLTEDELKLFTNLISLKDKLRNFTRAKFFRVNPFYEDIFDWKERGAYLFGENSNITIYNSSTIVGDVKVGNNTWIGPFTSIDGTGGLEIGAYCALSASVHILTHDTAKWCLSGGKCNYEYSPVKIGDCCFLGVGAVVTRGVTIGNNCLIGAGAVVTSNIPDFSIVLGVPGKIKGKVIIDDNNVSLEYYK